ncbi:MAG: DUF58 domain-containing protein [bacterium]|nr:DUF58 domain-containing protein [bacterium]
MFKYFDPAAIAKVDKIELKAKLIVEGFLTGLHKSPFFGLNVEFAEHRPYNQGDEIRFIDWKIYGKTDRFYIKQFEAETNMSAYILLDKSMSMSYSGAKSKKISKIEYSSYISAALAYLMFKQNDNIGLVTFDTGITDILPPKKSLSNYRNILYTLEQVKPSSKTQISSALHILAEKLKRRGLIILISDLWDDTDEIISGIKHLRHEKHEVIVFHILDDDEINLPFKGPITFIDLESGLSLKTVAENIQSKYKESVKDMEQFFLKELGRNQIDYMLVSTETPFDKLLLKYLAKRRRLYR